MGVTLKYFASLLAAGAVAAAVVVAPSAAAAQDQSAGGGASSSDSGQGHQSCVSLGGTQSQCQSPGNAQVYDAPPQVDYFPYAGGAT
jgi:invasion protein IalB